MDEERKGMRMRRLLTLILALALLSALPGAARAEYDGLMEEDRALFEKWCVPEGDALTVREGLRLLGSYAPDYLYDPEKEDWDLIEDPEAEKLFEENESLSFYGDEISFSRIRLPESLEIIGSEAFSGLHFTEFTLPRGLKKVCSFAFYACRFDVFRIEAELPWEQLWFGILDCTVKAWEVPEDHPLYTVIDGALYTRDGKTLLNYPNGRTDAHWDVPAGTERIASHAICNENLKTVSLPVGLQALEDYAFAGCTRLQAVALPLTVKEIGDCVFSECVSLELVSLPEGLEADRNENWAKYYADDKIFRGDNGDTWANGDPYDESTIEGYLRGYYKPARLLGGGEMVPVYNKNDEIAFYLPDGYVVVAMESVNGRCQIEDCFESTVLGWVDLASVRLISNETLYFYNKAVLKDVRDEDQRRVWAGDDFLYEADLNGPLITLYWNDYSDSVTVPLSDVEMYRNPDGPDGEYGIAVSEDVYTAIPLKDAPGGAEIDAIYSGDQVKVLEEKDGFVRVSTGIVEGWLPQENYQSVPKVKEGN